MILSQLNYGILVWGSNTNKLFKLQKKAVRIITCSKYNAHTGPIFKSIKSLKIDDIFKVNILKFYYKYCQKELPSYLQAFNFITRSDIHAYNTRHKNALCLNKSSTKTADKCLRNITPRIINDTDKQILDKMYTHSQQGFNWYIKQYIINTYQTECLIENCYVCKEQ